MKRGDIKKILILEELPKPVNFSGGRDQISLHGTYMLHRIIGTVPVEKDGAAHFEVPALRSLFFVTLDENDMSIKRMQSFTTVMPRATTSCVGCHGFQGGIHKGLDGSYRHEMRIDKPEARYNRSLLYSLTRPALSRALLAPLPR